MPGFADERWTAGFTIEIRQAERAGAAAEAQDSTGRLPRHDRGSRAGDRMHKRRRETARGGESSSPFASSGAFVNVYADRISREINPD
jgi:hypothetical protein